MQKEVIFIDLYPQKGHFHFNNEIISAFTKFANVTVRSPERNYLTDENKKKVFHISENKTKLIYEKKTRFKYLELFYNYYSIARHIKKNNYSLIYVLTFQNIHLMLFLINLNKKILGKTFFNLHNNLSNILASSNSREKFFFSFYQKRIKAICNNSLILDTALDYGFKFNSLNLVRHPLIVHNLQIASEYIYDSVFISLGNNNQLLNELILQEAKNQVLSESDLKIFIRISGGISSKSIDLYESEWLDESKKNSILASTWSVGVFFEENYKLRVSGSIIEALSNNKIVFATITDISEYFSNLYPDIVILIDSIEDFIEKLSLHKFKIKSTSVINQFIEFQKSNSHDNLTTDCKLLFNHINPYQTLNNE